MKIRFSLALALFTLMPLTFTLMPLTATAETQEDQIACMSDAFAVCGHAIPDRDRVAACLSQNYSRLSSGCREVMARYSRPEHRAMPRSRPRMSSVHD